MSSSVCLTKSIILSKVYTHENIYLKYCIDSNFPEHTTSSSSSSSSSKRPRLDQIPAANLDADDPLTDVSARTARLGGHLVVIATH